MHIMFVFVNSAGIIRMVAVQVSSLRAPRPPLRKKTWRKRRMRRKRSSYKILGPGRSSSEEERH